MIGSEVLGAGSKKVDTLGVPVGKGGARFAPCPYPAGRLAFARPFPRLIAAAGTGEGMSKIGKTAKLAET